MKKILVFLISFAAAELFAGISFTDNGKIFRERTLAVPAEAGKLLRVNSGESPVKGKTVFSTRPGVLKKNTNYLITFEYRLLTKPTEDVFERYYHTPTDPFFHFGIRSLKNRKIIDPLRITRNLSPEWRQMTLRVFIPGTADDFIFHVDAYGKIQGEFRNLSITENSVAKGFIPISSADSPAGMELKIPAGAKEFTVDLPVDPDRSVVQASAFGVSEENPDNTAALRKAIEYASKIKAGKLVLPSGTLRFAGEGRFFQFRDLKDFEFDGNGATLIFYQDLRKEKSLGRFFDIVRCERIRFRNMKIDWDWQQDPLAALVKIRQVNHDEIDFEFVDYDYFPRRDLRIAKIVKMHPVTRIIQTEDGYSHNFEFFSGTRVPKTTWLSGNVLRVKDNGSSWEKERLHLLKPGDYYRLQQYHSDLHCFHHMESHHVTFEDIDIYSVPGFAFQSRILQSNWQLVRVNVAPPPGKKERVITCTVDTYDHEASLGNMKMIDCRFVGGHDDAVNMLDGNFPVQKSGKRSVIIRNRRAGMLRPGDEVEFFEENWQPADFRARIKMIRTLRPEQQQPNLALKLNRNIDEIEFDRDIPEPAGELFVLINRSVNGGNVILRGCTFENINGTGTVVQHSNVTIENCHYRYLPRRALMFKTGYTCAMFNEGIGVQNVVIRNCTFEEVGRDGTDLFDGLESSIVMTVFYHHYPYSYGAWPARMIRDVLFENNTFINAFGMTGLFHSAENVIFRNNTVIANQPRIQPVFYRGSFLAANVKDLFIIGNRFSGKEYMPAAGVYFDPESTENIVVSDNVFSDSQN